VALRQEVDLRTDQIGDRERLLARQDADRDRCPGGDRGVGARFDLRDPRGIQIVEFEVHPRAVEVHLPAGDLRAELAPDRAAEDVHRRVRPHQPVAALPIEFAVYRLARRGQRRVPGEVMHDLAVALLHLLDRPAPLTSPDRPHIVRLAAPAGVERRAIEHERARLGVEGGHGRLECAQIAIGLE